MSTTFSNAKVGEQVFSHTFGWGVIEHINPDSAYPIYVRFHNCGETHCYTPEGFFHVDTPVQSLFWDVVGVTAPEKPVHMKVVNGVEIPDISFKPTTGSRCYIPSPITPELYLRIQYCSAEADEHLSKHGLCYPDTELGKRVAILHARAMLISS
jgi:hypothetical protein